MKQGIVYILQSEKNSRYYIGSTNNIERRLAEHNGGKTKSLYYLRPLKLVFQQQFSDIQDARRMERKMKNLKNKSIIERIIKDKKILMGL